MASATLAELRAVTYKQRDSWWTVLLADPIAIHLVRFAARHRWITPNRITVLGFLLGLGSAACFATAERPWLIAGALLYHVIFILDCVDGKLARWQGSGSILGGWMDLAFDHIRVVVCVVALTGGQYLATGQGVYLLLGVVVVFLNMFRYFNGFLMDRARFEMRERLDAARAAVEDRNSAGARLPALGRVRDWMHSRRIRLDVFSGIEFQMAVLIIAPLTDAILTVTVVACALMVAFELAHSYRFWLAAQRFRRAIEASAVPDQRAAPAVASADPARR